MQADGDGEPLMGGSGGVMALDQRFAGQTVAGVLEAQAAENPDRVFLIAGDRRFTYAQVNARSTALAAALTELGVERGDRIAVDLPTGPSSSSPFLRPP